MKKALVLAVLLAFSGSLAGTTSARRRKKVKKQKKKRNTKSSTATAIKALQGPYKFGSNQKTIFAQLKKLMTKRYLKIIEKTQGDIAKDKVRRIMHRSLKKLKKNVTAFRGKKTGWDTSIIDDQFAHGNNESMVAYVDKGEQKFFFFHNNKLYKIFISLPTKQFSGYSFAKFQMAMEAAYGKAQEVYITGVGGDSELHHLRWIGSGGIELWAMDKTDVYGNFVFILVDTAAQKTVLAERKSRGVKIASGGDFEINPIVKKVTKSRPLPRTKKRTKR